MQAARGTSLSSSDHTDHQTADPGEGPPQPGGVRRLPEPRLLALFVGIAVGGYVADLLTKMLAAAHLVPGVPVHVVGDLVSLYIARNPGAAFSTGTSYTLLLSLVAIVAAAAVVWVARRLGSLGWAIGLGFLLAGILGNLTDRVFREPGVLRGHVVDFVQLPHFPVFNVADVCINIAAVIVIVQALRGVSVSGRRDRGGSGTDTPEAPAP